MTFKQKMKDEMRDAGDARRELQAWSLNRAQNWKKAFQLKHLWKWFVAILSITLLILLSHYHNTIVKYFEPHKEAIVNLPASWLIPIGILILVSFPPLFGHEIILLVTGLIWGLWVGFGIAAAGTFIGELLCYFAFKYLFTARAQKFEHGSVFYACLARLMREGGVWVIILVRFSILPGHIVTAIQSTVGMPLWIYCIAVVVSLPKQLVVVYLGVLFGVSSASGDSPAQVSKERRISLSVFFLTAFMTLIAAYVVYMRARKLYPEILRESQERKSASLGGSNDDPFNASDEAFSLPTSNPYGGGNYGATEIPLRQHTNDHILPPVSAVSDFKDPFETSHGRTDSLDSFHNQGHQPEVGEGGPFRPEEYMKRNGEPTFSPLPMEDSPEPWSRR